MSGRLSYPINNKIQAFPYKTWMNEFKIAEDLGLSCIEWIYEHPNKDHNPICSNEGIKELKNLSRQHNISINSLVADNFMKDPLCNTNSKILNRSIDLLNYLIKQCFKAGIQMVELPLMGKTSIRNKNNRNELVINIRDSLDYAKERNIKIVFETDLPPSDFLDFILVIDHSAVGVNYDMGNSAMFGFDPKEEIATVGKHIYNVHIKDGVKNGGTVPLGTGSTDFESVFAALKSVNYKGDFIFQAARQDLQDLDMNLDPIATVKNYIEFVKKIVAGT